MKIFDRGSAIARSTVRLAATTPPNSGQKVASSAQANADLNRAAAGGGNNTVNQPTNNIAGGQAASQVASAPPNVYDNDLVKTMFEGYSLT